MRRFLLRYLELVFTLAGLLVIFGTTKLFDHTGIDSWKVAAVTATLVGVIHGLLFWMVRRRQRQVRRETLGEARRMLRDVVVNQLAVVRIGAAIQNTPGSDTKAALARMETAIEAIDHTLTDLSEESLARWQSRYSNIVDRPTT